MAAQAGVKLAKQPNARKTRIRTCRLMREFGVLFDFFNLPRMTLAVQSQQQQPLITIEFTERPVR
jgi:hypothetical protein